jgi:BirA family biotin operon repressor/biotin-[acetyl-CoA-carboxylase] ligase
MQAPQETWQLTTRRLGQRVLVFDQLDSTNNYAAQLAQDPAHEGWVVLARDQSAGRGQHGRTWLCPPGQGVLLSAVLFPPPELRRPVVLAAWAAVAVCEAIRTLTDLQAKVKWPNDVLIQGRKVCGILIEQSRGTVAGLGLNVNQSAESFAECGLPQAASLAVFHGKPLEWRAVAERLVLHLDDEYDRLCSGDHATLEACWKWRTGLLGKQVVVECHDSWPRGRLLELTWDALELEQADGSLLRLKPEAVRHVTAVDMDE